MFRSAGRWRWFEIYFDTFCSSFTLHFLSLLLSTFFALPPLVKLVRVVQVLSSVVYGCVACACEWRRCEYFILVRWCGRQLHHPNAIWHWDFEALAWANSFLLYLFLYTWTVATDTFTFHLLLLKYYVARRNRTEEGKVWEAVEPKEMDFLIYKIQK